MENNHLTQVQIYLLDEIKRKGIELGDLIEDIRGEGEYVDQRWLSIGTTNLQTGLMALARAVEKPDIF